MFRAITLALLLALPGVQEGTLVWSKPEGETHFAAGKELFGKKEYEDAFDKFKAARKVAKGRSTKSEVEKWMQASRGGLQLEALKKAQAGGSSSRAVYNQAEGLIGKYEGTPIHAEFQEYVQKLQSELFTTLEDFERVGKRFSEKYGKTFVDEPKFVREGQRALKWDLSASKSPELKVSFQPSMNLSGYEAVSFWMCFPKAKANYQVVFKGLGKSKSDYGDTIVNAYFSQQTGHSGWKRVQIPLKQFQAQGDVSWERISDFRIQFPSKKQIDVYVDYIALVKN